MMMAMSMHSGAKLSLNSTVESHVPSSMARVRAALRGRTRPAEFKRTSNLETLARRHVPDIDTVDGHTACNCASGHLQEAERASHTLKSDTPVRETLSSPSITRRILLL